MNKEQLILNLNSDLANEYTHMLFYLQSSVLIQGIHRQELREFLSEQAKSEMDHVQKFSDLIVGLGGVPEVKYHSFPILVLPQEILRFAIGIESTVLDNYVTRMSEACELGGTDGKMIELFLEEQFLDTRTDLDHLNQLIK